MRGLLSLTMAAFVGFTFGTSAAQAAWPERPITMIVPWSAGGGTDAVARAIANGLEKKLGEPVNVVNRTGGSGVVGHTEMVNAKPDGYTIGLATAEFISYYWTNVASFTYENVTPIALVNFDASAVCIQEDSSWKNLADLLKAVKEAPAGTYKMSAPIGGAYHIAFGGLLMSRDIDPKAVVVVPNQGAAPGFQELASGGVQITPFSLPEGKAMIEAGRARPIAVLSNERISAFPDVPTVKESIGEPYAAGTWRGLVGPKGMPADIVKKIADAAQEVTSSAEYKSFLDKRGFGFGWQREGDFGKFLADQHQRTGDVLQGLGLRLRK